MLFDIFILIYYRESTQSFTCNLWMGRITNKHLTYLTPFEHIGQQQQFCSACRFWQDETCDGY